MRSVRLRDPIHDFIELAPHEVAAIDASRYQRLREIRQLAMTYLVYPGALHTRFEHSLGVCHVAGKIGVELDLSGEDLKAVRAAALLHGIGHGPFSHVSEQVLDEENGVSGVHEAISVAIIRSDANIRRALGEELADRAANLVAHEGEFSTRTTMRDIVSGPSDADKLDYLLRDSYFAGVNYGRYDLGRLLDTVVAIPGDVGESYLGFRAAGLWAVEELLLARHHMHRQVYGHKTRIASDIMIQRALRHGIADGVVDRRAYAVPLDSTTGRPAPDPDFLEHYLAQTDARTMIALLDQSGATPSKDLAERLSRRDLLRQGARINLRDKRGELGPRLGRILDQERFGARVSELEESIAKELGCPAYLVALKIDEPGNPVFRQPNASVTAKDILLTFPDREPDILQEASEIFRNATEENQRFASLYVPKTDEITNDKCRDLLWNALKSA